MDSLGIGAAANVCSEAAKGIFQEAKRHIRYVIIYKKNVEKFEEKLKTLNAKRKTVDQVVDVAKRNGEKIKADVLDWRNRVDKLISEEEKEVKALEVKAMSKCFGGLCPNTKSRYRLSRKAEEAVTTFDDLINECHFPQVGFRVVPKTIVRVDFETFKSREKVFNDIMESLKVSTVSMIGVYGMPGVGKTSLVKEVQRQAQEDKSFNSVVRVIVSQSPDVPKIQAQIADQLGLNLEEKSTVGRAGRLWERLTAEKNQEKRALVILDNMWEKLDLEEVGIPFGSLHKGCKILLTSRNTNVLSKMGATKTFELGVLDDKEAWGFFKKEAGDCVERADLRPTAIEVAKRCAGLPLAISTVARALQNKELFVWKDALRQLQRPYSEHPDDISDEVYKAIELSFNQLPNDPLKQTFLLCSLLRRDTRIEDLLRYAIGLGLINGVNTLEEARYNLLKKTSDLKEACLLIHSDTGEKYWDVHDLTYIVAKSIASKDYQMFSLGKEDDRAEWPCGESLKKCNQFWLLNPSINTLPDQLNCPQLKHFLLYSKNQSLMLSADFFMEATNLKVLALVSMQFSSLPSSISLLTSLSTLCLDECKLGADISIIGGLKSLEILSLLKSDIRILPKEIGQLVKLKLLDVSWCAKLKTISAGVLSSLTRLEELYMGGTSIQWGQSSTASLAELKALSRLSTLEVQIPDAKTAPHDFFEGLQKLERYKIFIGEEWECFGNYQYSRTINLRLSISIDDLDRGIKKLLKRTEDLHLDELKDVKIALQELTDEESLSGLKNLHIQNGLDIEYIINGENVFPQLQSLTLQSLPQLISFCPQHETNATKSLPQHELPLFSEKISFPCLKELRLKSINVTRVWHNQLSTSFCAYGKLTTLKIEGCGSLKNVFPVSIARDLPQLNDLIIFYCGVEEIVSRVEDGSDSETTITFVFNQLSSLELCGLSECKCFYPGKHSTKWPMLEELKAFKCGEMKIFGTQLITQNEQLDSQPPLFLVEKVVPKLQRLALDSDYTAMISGGQFSSSLFHEIKAFRVEGDSAKSVDFQFSFLERFNKLEELSISNCEIKELFCNEGDTCSSSKGTYAGTLSTIRKLELVGLYNLKGYLWKQDVRVDHILPNLETLEVYGCENLMSLGSSSASFQNLTTLDVWECREMKYLDTCFAVQSLAKLKILRIRDCVSMKKIVASEGEQATYKVIFSRLKSLELVNLPRLESFCSGNHAFGFPCLEEVIVSGCPELGIFCKGVINAPLLQSVEYGRDKGHWGGDLNSTVQQLHSIKVGHRDIECFVLSEYSKSMEIWNEKKLDFKNLKVLQVEECNSLIYVFSVSMALDLVQLTDLKVKNCAMMENIVKKGTEETTIDTLLLPKLCSIKLKSCSELTSFCTGSITLQCPSLIEIEVDDCPNMYAMACTREEGDGEKTPFFNDKETFPVLEELYLFQNDNMKEIWHGALPDQYFCKLRLLTLFSFPDTSVTALFCFIQSLPNLEVLQVKRAAFEELFPCEVLRDEEKHAATLALLKELTLMELPMLTHLWKKEESFAEVLYNLEILQVMECSRLMNLVPTSLSFKHLTTLKVSKCHGFRNLVTFTTAKSMVQLKTMSVMNCQMIEEIIASTTDEVTDVIVFNQLESLELDGLPCLSRFCSGNYGLVFPMLEKVIIRQCQQMEFFTRGEVSTPMLHGLQSTKGKHVRRWEGDLNATIQKLFTEKEFKFGRSLSCSDHLPPWDPPSAAAFTARWRFNTHENGFEVSAPSPLTTAASAVNRRSGG
ncbi:hypothetical protein GQ457_02G035620 [Hibiscus cannabinus]